MYLTIQGIVLRVTDYNDRDALLTVLSRNHGKLTVKARGLRRKNSPLIAPCQLLAYGEFTLFEYKGQYTINEAHSIELFQGLRRDLQKLSLGTYRITVHFEDGTASGSFTVTEASDIPQTGDTIGLWVTVMLVSLAAVSGAVLILRKRT